MDMTFLEIEPLELLALSEESLLLGRTQNQHFSVIDISRFFRIDSSGSTPSQVLRIFL